MMTRNDALLADLNNSLENIKNHSFYETELNELNEIIQRSLSGARRSILFDKSPIVKAMMKIIHEINEDIARVEVEMQGVGNYSAYTRQRVKIIAVKQVIKDELQAMLKRIVSARPEVCQDLQGGLASWNEHFVK